MKDTPVIPPPLHNDTLEVPTGTTLGQGVDVASVSGIDTLDLVHRVIGMYRLLDLISEQGSGGAGGYLLVGVLLLEGSLRPFSR